MIVNNVNPCKNCGSADTTSHHLNGQWCTGCRTCFKHTNPFATAAESREEWNLYNPLPKGDPNATIQRKLDECHTFIESILNSNLVASQVRNAAYELLNKHQVGS